MFPTITRRAVSHTAPTLGSTLLETNMISALSRRFAFSVAVLIAAGAPALSQIDPAARFLDNCRRNRSDNAQFCEVRNFTMPVSKALTVDGRDNGGITVHAWDKNEVQVVAMVQAQAESEQEARDIARQVVVAGANGSVRAEGPRSARRQSWSVSYEVWTPRNTELALTASNGGISVDGIEARMNLETVNGGLSLTDVDGDVRGVTTNGGITAQLGGDRWRGSGLDLRTSNGGVHLVIPSNYSAVLETGTVNGGLDIGFPVTIQGAIGRQFSAQLGGGGATIRAVTTNGGVSIRRR